MPAQQMALHNFKSALPAEQVECSLQQSLCRHALGARHALAAVQAQPRPVGQEGLAVGHFAVVPRKADLVICGCKGHHVSAAMLRLQVQYVMSSPGKHLAVGDLSTRRTDEVYFLATHDVQS